MGLTIRNAKLTVAGDISASAGLSAAITNSGAHGLSAPSYFGGNVGIGTNRPDYTLHVKSTTDHTKMRLTNDNSTNWDFTVGNSGYYQGNLFISNPGII